MSATGSVKRSVVVAVAATFALSLAGCATEAGDRRAATSLAGSSASTPETGVIATDLAAPWSIAFHRGTPLVSERDSARIVELSTDGRAREVTEVAGVTPSGEGGLLGIATHDGYLYAYYTAGQSNRVVRFRLAGERGSLSVGPGQTVLDGIAAARNHNGGRIAFGPDQKLYVTTGDAGDRSSAQDRKTLSGKILRVNPDGTVPGDNPFRGSPVYSYGHRNPQGIAWTADGTMYASEFGQDTWDELNVIKPGGNYGWPEVEGVARSGRFIDPVQQWNPDDASPSGIAVAGDSIYVANLRGQRLTRVPLNSLSTSTYHDVGRYGRLRDVVVAPDGSLWILTNNTDGRGDPTPGDDRIIRLRAA